MTPENYLRQYIEPLSALAGAAPTGDWQALVLEADYYYPPHSELGSSLDMLNRTGLLEVLQQILAAEYPQQRLSKSTAQEFLGALRRLKDEQAWRQTEIGRLEEVLAQQQADHARMTAELIEEHQTGLQQMAVELERCHGERAVLFNETSTLRANLADLQASTSWKLTGPLRWLGRLMKAANAAPDT